jgi:flagellar protein FliO/FliZ
MDPHPVLDASLAAVSPGAPGLWQMAASLALVLGLILVSVPILRRLLGARLGLGQAGARLRLTQTLPLGGRRFLSLVEVDGQELLLGISSERIELLHVVGGERGFPGIEELGQ